MTNSSRRDFFGVRHSVIPSSFVLRHSTFSSRAFTLIELLVVIAIIIVLAGLILSTMGYVQKKGARSRAETEIASMSAACESYKADNAVYPRDPKPNVTIATDKLDARTDGNPLPTPTPPILTRLLHNGSRIGKARRSSFARVHHYLNAAVRALFFNRAVR